MAEPDILVIGAGPAGLAAGHRLQEHGRDEWLILETGDTVGGLARSYTVDGYTFDIGGHVLFSRDQDFLALLDRLLGGEHTTIRREAWVHTSGRHVRYPFQNHLGGLDPQVTHECLAGLVAARLAAAAGTAGRPENFHDWVHLTFGAGIARHFMLPYNAKVWAAPAEHLTYDWISDRVAEVDLDTVLRNVVLRVDDAPWGPNSTFRYPLRGGTGRLWQRMAEPLADRIRLRCPVVRVDTGTHRLQTSDGRWRRYERLLSTMPLDEFIAACTDAP
ncbi:FAD-dependent oxidoreductase, partial [Micromonospora yasonensis]|uniref:protoporphyrinogen/coproporphyrinogen oxidase n=1 Tax=Micromonospora yasonensis TaxID=1128667 RepID=UPI00222ED6FB